MEFGVLIFFAVIVTEERGGLEQIENVFLV